MCVHVWLTWLGVRVASATSFHDVDLYRQWMHHAVHDGQWPVFDGSWVYPVGAIIPMSLPALVTTVSTTGYAIAWCVMVAGLNGCATAALLRRRPDGTRNIAGACWWLAFLLALGPVAIGRLDSIVAPLMVLALLAGVDHPRVASALLTTAAWIKVAPGAALLPLVTAARRPVRSVVLPALAVCCVAVGAVTLGGGLSNITSFMSTQAGRGLQAESVTATPWVLASLTHDDVAIRLNGALATWEVRGPGASTAAAALDILLLIAVGLTAGLLWWARRGEGKGSGSRPGVFLPGTLLVLIVLIVVNKVGSPQFMAWLAAPVAVMLSQARGERDAPDQADSDAAPPIRPCAAGTPWLLTVAAVVLATAGLTQVVFPWGYDEFLNGNVLVTSTLVLRNVLLVTITVLAVIGVLAEAKRPAAPVSRCLPPQAPALPAVPPPPPPRPPSPQQR